MCYYPASLLEELSSEFGANTFIEHMQVHVRLVYIFLFGGGDSDERTRAPDRATSEAMPTAAAKNAA